MRAVLVKNNVYATAPRPIIADCENGGANTSDFAALLSRRSADRKMGRYAGVYADHSLTQSYDTVIIDQLAS